MEIEVGADLIEEFMDWLLEDEHIACTILRGDDVLAELFDKNWDIDELFDQYVYGDIICGQVAYRAIVSDYSDYVTEMWT